jgi:hypothetical protein
MSRCPHHSCVAWYHRILTMLAVQRKRIVSGLFSDSRAFLAIMSHAQHDFRHAERDDTEVSSILCSPAAFHHDEVLALLRNWALFGVTSIRDSNSSARGAGLRADLCRPPARACIRQLRRRGRYQHLGEPLAGNKFMGNEPCTLLLPSFRRNLQILIGCEAKETSLQVELCKRAVVI